MRRLDTRGTIAFVDVAGAATCPLDRVEMLALFHVREADGPLLSGATAFAAMWRPVSTLRPLGEAVRSRRVLFSISLFRLGFANSRFNWAFSSSTFRLFVYDGISLPYSLRHR